MIFLSWSVSYSWQFVTSPHLSPHTVHVLSMSAPYISGLGNSANSDKAEMRIVIAADLSCGSITRKLMMDPPTLAVEASKDTMAMKAIVRRNILSQSSEGQNPSTAPDKFPSSS